MKQYSWGATMLENEQKIQFKIGERGHKYKSKNKKIKTQIYGDQVTDY